MTAPEVSAVLPYAVIAAVMVLRWRSIGRPQPLRPAMLVIVPVVIALVAVLVLLELPATGWRWPALGSGLMLGGLAGWQRTRMMQLEREEGTGRILVRNSPAAFLFIIGVLALRKLFAWETGLGAAGPVYSPAAMQGIYAALGFAVGVTTASRAELWRRASGLD